MLRFVTADVFTDRPFGGNPLAVVLGADALTTATMQAIAAEFNYSETTFVLRPSRQDHHAQVRIFTPRHELPFAGHPSIGTGFVLALEMLRRGETVPERLLLEEAAGLVPVRPLFADDAMVGAELTAPGPPLLGRTFDASLVAAALRLPDDAVVTDRHPPRLASAGLPFLLVELASAALVDRAVADPALLAALLPGDGAEGLYLYARSRPGLLHARMFAPGGGIEEDPATGSAAAALGVLLGGVAGEAASFEIDQGVAMGRPSRLSVRIDGATVRVAGRCVPVMSGHLAVG